MRNKTCAEETKQGKNTVCVSLSKMQLQKQATCAEVGTRTKSHRALSTRDYCNYREERTEAAGFAYYAY
jgi:hypothetical protein